MNIIDAFFNNGQLNWDAISTIFNIILVVALVVVTSWYAKQVKKQTEFMKIDRLVKEMDKLVAPLYSKMEDKDKIIFQKGVPGNIDNTLPRVQGYFRFWDEIRQNKYLGPIQPFGVSLILPLWAICTPFISLLSIFFFASFYTTTIIVV